MIRKIATAASVTRIMYPAATAVPENQRSPGRCLTLTAGALTAGAVVVLMVSRSRRWCQEDTRPGAREHRAGRRVLLDDDQVDGRVDLLGQRLRDRRVACSRGCGLLALGAGHVLQEGLHDRGDRRVDVLFARDHVADEDDRVDARLVR